MHLQSIEEYVLDEGKIVSICCLFLIVNINVTILDPAVDVKVNLKYFQNLFIFLRHFPYCIFAVTTNDARSV